MLKEIGIPLKNIKEIIDKALDDDNKVLKTLDMQLKAVTIKINELGIVKNIIEQSVNKILKENEIDDFNECFDKILIFKKLKNMLRS